MTADPLARALRAMTWLCLAVPIAILLRPTLATVVSTAGRTALAGVLIHRFPVVGATLGLATAVGVVGTAAGAMMAAVHHAYRFTGRGILHWMTLAPVLLPPVTASTTLLQIWGNNCVVAQLTGGDWVSVYGFTGLALADILAMVPLAYLAVLSGLRTLDEGLIDQARDLGLPTRKILRVIVLPHLWPELAAVFLLLVANTAVDVANPLALGGSYQVLATRLREAAIGEGDAVGAAATSSVMLAICVLAWLVMTAISSRTGGAAPQQSSIRTRRRPPSSIWQRVMVGVAWFVAGANALSLPVVMLGSVIDTTSGLSWTASGYRELLAGQNGLALADSVIVAAGATVMAMVAGSAIVSTAGLRWGGSVSTNLLASSALTLPLALGALEIWRRTGTSGNSTSTILVLVMTVQGLVLVPVVVAFLRARTDAMTLPIRQSAAGMGMAPARMLRPLIIPQLRPALTAATALAFAMGLTSVPSVILLTGADTPFIAAQIVTEVEAGRLTEACTLSTVTAITVALVAWGIWLSAGGRRRA